ncbi:MAG: ArdC family protein [Salinivirgaceae bacterium]|jgi:hypothetical protein|nr:ArdC family protein [Salinivirgaceae bacterium]
MKTKRKEQYIEKRKQLIALSVVMRQLIEVGKVESVNEGLKEMYIDENPDINEFKTFRQWKEEGATVRKGEKAFVIWGQPRKAEQTTDESEESEEYKYWPICYLFANTQVVTAEQMKEHREKANRPKSAAMQPRQLEPIDDII